MNIYAFSPSTSSSFGESLQEEATATTWLSPSHSRSRNGSSSLHEDKDKYNHEDTFHGKIASRRSSDYSMSPTRISLTSSIYDNRSSGACYLPFAKVPLAQRSRELTSPKSSYFQIPAVKSCIFCDKNDRRCFISNICIFSLRITFLTDLRHSAILPLGEHPEDRPNLLSILTAPVTFA